LRKNINWLKDRGFFLSTLIILAFFDKFFGSLVLGQKKPRPGETGQGSSSMRKIYQGESSRASNGRTSNGQCITRLQKNFQG
jgi:hypothetical protein